MNAVRHSAASGQSPGRVIMGARGHALVRGRRVRGSGALPGGGQQTMMPLRGKRNLRRDLVSPGGMTPTIELLLIDGGTRRGEM